MRSWIKQYRIINIVQKHENKNAAKEASMAIPI
jgi:hypothetical protein